MTDSFAIHRGAREVDTLLFNPARAADEVNLLARAFAAEGVDLSVNLTGNIYVGRPLRSRNTT